MAKEERQIKREKLRDILNEVSAMRTILGALTQSSKEIPEYAVRWVKELKERLEKIASLTGELMEMEYPKR